MQPRPYTILIVDDDARLGDELRHALGAPDRVVQVVGDVGSAASAIDAATPDLIITSDRLPDGSGLALLAREEIRGEGVAAIVLAREPAVEDVVEAMSHGALDVIEKPVFPGHLAAVVAKARSRRRTAPAAPEPAGAARIESFSRPPIIGRSPALEELKRAIGPVTRAPRATVLIEGESGTGKELIARAIHYDGPRRDRPFMAVNCATLTENLLEAELFGYEKGAFTGALSSGKKGLFEAASGGTLFLDEVGELAAGLQAKLLRVLQEGTFKRVGGLTDIRVDTRIMAATNRDLRQEVEHGRFRADLFYRLNVVPILVPPLRERAVDIPDLCEHFLEKHARELGKDIAGFSKAARARLESYDWPGNVRELRNVCEYAVIVCDGPIIEPRHLTIPERADATVRADSDVLPLRDRSIRGMEMELIRMVLSETRFNVTRSANILGINRSTLYNKMRDYGLQRDDRSNIRRSV